MTLQLGQLVARRLGACAVLTRTDDQNLSLGERVAMARRLGATAFVSLHANMGRREARGTEAWVHTDASDASRAMATVIHRQLLRLGGPDRGVQAGPLAVLSPTIHHPETAACLVEVDFISNAIGERRLGDPRALELLAGAIARGVAEADAGRATLGSRRLGTRTCIFGIDSNSPRANVVRSVGAVATTDVPAWVATAAGAPAARPQFVGRYLDAHGTSDLSTAEVIALSDAGLSVVSIFERGNSIAVMTEANGYTHGKAAWARAATLSQPLGTPVYFAVDFSPTPDQLTHVWDYFEGIRRALDEHNRGPGVPPGTDAYGIGVYGQPHVLTFCQATSSRAGSPLATWFWRWGGTEPVGGWSGANLEQLYGPNFYGNDRDQRLHFVSNGTVVGERFCGIAVDFNVSFKTSLEDVGAWRIGS